MNDNKRISVAILFVALVGLCVFGRLLPHPPNFSPVAAAALLAGCLFRHRAVACLVPIIGMAISDQFIGGYEFRVMLVVYASMLLPVFLRGWIARRVSVRRVATSALLCSLVFFVATNLAVWLFSDIYALTLSGLVECYAAALPFLKYTIAGDLFWSGVFFAAYRLAGVQRFAPRQRVPCPIRAH